MQVKLSKNSWYMKLLKWMWGVDYNKYPNLCPLFWSVIGSLFILPVYIILLPFIKVKPLKNILVKSGEVIAIMCFYAFLFLIVEGASILYYISRVENGIATWLYILAYVVCMMLIIGIVAYLLLYLARYMAKKDADSIVIKYISSVYYKSCPFITWK